MHDIDRTFTEYTPETESYEDEQFQLEEEEWLGETEDVFGEAELMELAVELLEVSDEEELNYFLGSLIKKAAGAVKKVVSSPLGQSLGSLLKGAAKKALPMLGSAVGGYLGGSTGAKMGSRLASSAGKMFGLETEGLSAEDEQFELAKQYVRFAGDAVKNAVSARGGDPRAIARKAVATAAHRHAPGLLPAGVSASKTATAQTDSLMGRARSGRWVRRGSRIVLYGV